MSVKGSMNLEGEESIGKIESIYDVIYLGNIIFTNNKCNNIETCIRVMQPVFG